MEGERVKSLTVKKTSLFRSRQIERSYLYRKSQRERKKCVEVTK